MDSKDQNAYPKTKVNAVKRLPNRGHYDFSTIHNLINNIPILNVSFNDPASTFPVSLPMIGCTGNFENQDADPSTSEQDIYLHGYVSNRFARLVADHSNHPSNTSEVGEDSGAAEEPLLGLPLTISAAELDGLVLALSAFHHSLNYRSAVIFGHATLLAPSHTDERLYAMARITNALLPGRWEATRQPPLPAELASTSIIKVRIASASAKVRTGGPSEERKDEKDEGVRGRIWTGVVPSWRAWGEPVAARECRVDGEGKGKARERRVVEEWAERETGRGRAYAWEALRG